VEKVDQFTGSLGTDYEVFSAPEGAEQSVPQTAQERLQFQRQEAREAQTAIQDRMSRIEQKRARFQNRIQDLREQGADIDQQAVEQFRNQLNEAEQSLRDSEERTAQGLDRLMQAEQSVQPGEVLQVRDGRFTLTDEEQQVEPVSAGQQNQSSETPQEPQRFDTFESEEEQLVRDVQGGLTAVGIDKKTAHGGGEVVQSFASSVGSSATSAAYAPLTVGASLGGNEEWAQYGRNQMKEEGREIVLEASEFSQGMKDFLPFDKVARNLDEETREKAILPPDTTAETIESAAGGELPVVGTDFQVGLLGAPAAVGVATSRAVENPAKGVRQTAGEVVQGGTRQVRGLVKPTEAAAEVGGEVVMAAAPFGVPGFSTSVFSNVELATLRSEQAGAVTSNEVSMPYTQQPRQSRARPEPDEVPAAKRMPSGDTANRMDVDDPYAGAGRLSDGLRTGLPPAQQQSMQTPDGDEATVRTRGLEADRSPYESPRDVADVMERNSRTPEWVENVARETGLEPDRSGQADMSNQRPSLDQQEGFSAQEEQMLAERHPSEDISFAFDQEGQLSEAEVSRERAVGPFTAHVSQRFDLTEFDSNPSSNSRKGMARFTEQVQQPDPTPGDPAMDFEVEPNPRTDVRNDLTTPEQDLQTETVWQTRQDPSPDNGVDARPDSPVDTAADTGVLPDQLPDAALNPLVSELPDQAQQPQQQQRQFQQPQVQSPQQLQPPEVRTQPETIFADTQPETQPEERPQRNRRARRNIDSGTGDDSLLPELEADRKDTEKKQTAYVPDLTSTLFEIRGKAPETTSGLELRPLPEQDESGSGAADDPLAADQA